MAAKIFIDGEAGTTGLQIRERLAERGDLELLSISPDKRKDLDERQRLLNLADVAILCLPDEAARQSVSLIQNQTTRVIDASTAYRVADGWTYGFAEMDAGQSARIAGASRVANPGCWPQGAIAVLRPLVAAGLLKPDYPVTMNGISGYSGGGRSMIESYQSQGEQASQFYPYALTLKHKHLPELQAYSQLTRQPIFTPAVGRFLQGMLVSIPLHLSLLDKIPAARELHAAIADHYAGIQDGFVEVAPLNDETALDPQAYNGTNRMRLQVHVNEQSAQAVLLAAYDNLGKGASGAAVQNLNLMLGMAPKTSL